MNQGIVKKPILENIEFKVIKASNKQDEFKVLKANHLVISLSRANQRVVKKERKLRSSTNNQKPNSQMVHCLNFDLFRLEIDSIIKSKVQLNNHKSKSKKIAIKSNTKSTSIVKSSTLNLKNSLKLQASKKSILKKKRKFPSNLFDIDNFVINSTSKINERHTRLNIPIPKYKHLSEDYYTKTDIENKDSKREKENHEHIQNEEAMSLIDNSGIKLKEEGSEKIDDDIYLNIHEEYEKREKLYKQSYIFFKKNQNTNESVIPCHFESNVATPIMKDQKVLKIKDVPDFTSYENDNDKEIKENNKEAN